MSTVHCPNCHRALHLPRDREVATARCPICATEFDIPGGHSPPLPQPIPPVTQTIRPSPLPEEPDEPDEPLGFPTHSELDSPEYLAARNSLRTAGGWIKVASVVGLVQLALCGCCDFWDIDVRTRGRPDNLFAIAAILLVVRLVALLVMWSATDSLRRRQRLGYIRFAARISVALGLYMLWRSRLGWMLLFDAAPPGLPRGDTPLLTLYGLLQAVVAAPALVGGVWMLLLLGRPDVKALYPR